MDHTRKSSQRTIVRSFVLLLGGVALGALWRSRAAEPAPVEPERPQLALPSAARPARPARRPFGTRLGIAAAFVALFVAGGALTAWGGNEVAQLEDPAPAPPAASTTAEVAPASAPADAAPTPEAAPAPAADPAPEPVAHELPAEESAAVQAPSAPAVQAPASAPVAAPAPASQAPEAVVRPTVRLAPVAARPRRAPARVPSVVHAQRVAPDPEVTAPGTASVVWLNRQLPDPTPPSRRLRRTFVHKLVRASGKEWPLELALLRVQGRAALPVRPLGRRLATLSAKDHDEQATALALVGDSTAADRVVALAHYYRAVGDETLIQGLEASKARLELKLLADPRVTIYPGGRSDLEGGRVNVRVLATIAYLADTFGSVEVSSLVTGHRLYARPRVISAHVFGLAVDVAALGGTPIAGHQEPGGVTDQAVRALLLLPADVEPTQIISLLGLGGPSFAEADHADHVHVGF